MLLRLSRQCQHDDAGEDWSECVHRALRSDHRPLAPRFTADAAGFEPARRATWGASDCVVDDVM
jgi:hypothetical protein